MNKKFTVKLRFKVADEILYYKMHDSIGDGYPAITNSEITDLGLSQLKKYLKPGKPFRKVWVHISLHKKGDYVVEKVNDFSSNTIFLYTYKHRNNDSMKSPFCYAGFTEVFPEAENLIEGVPVCFNLFIEVE